MTRLLLFAAILLTLAGCRHNRCSTASNAASPCDNRALPVNYGGAPVMGVPTSYSGLPVASAVMPPVGNAIELPFPQESIPPTSLPVTGLPNGTRAVGLPK